MADSEDMTAIPKPAKGSAAKMREARRRLVETRERAAKDAAKARDRFTCRRCGRSTLHSGVMIEGAHLVSAGMGGDGGRYSSHQSDFVALCRDCHQGPRSVHSGHVKMVYGDAGGDGRVVFVDKKL